MKDQTNKKTIFLSHSSKDEALAKSIFDLLNRFINENRLSSLYEVFYSPRSLKEEDDNRIDWKVALPNAIEKSSVVIVLWTNNSINNRWVNYEIGIATAMKKNIVAVGIKGLNYDNIIPNQVQVLCMENKEDIKLMLKHTFRYSKTDQTVEVWSSSINVNSAIDSLIRETKRKCVYFVGSKQNNWNKETENMVEKFVEELSNKLLREGFKLASYPAVKHVGMTVAKTSLKFLDSYEIAGLYKFDETVGKLANKWHGDIVAWNKTMERFRDFYLDNKHCMVIIGGGENTENEYKVAQSKGIQIFPIPCFGGFGEILFRRLSKEYVRQNYNHPCLGCNNQNKQCDCINNFLTRFETYIPFEDIL